ncbi:MAG: hypothetical protein HYY25_09410 [Candidatus Wallbacteria bacterium]|nr:hypothetical protein [Candidatus Wallbacteria bacterium]
MTRLGDLKVDMPRLTGVTSSGAAPATPATTGYFAAKGGTALGGRSASVTAGELRRWRLRRAIDETVGVPYRRMGRVAAEGLDPIGLVLHVYSAIRMSLPDESESLRFAGKRLAADELVERGKFRENAWKVLAPGDVLFFWSKDRSTGRAELKPGLYHSDGKVAVASADKGKVVLVGIEGQAKSLAFIQRIVLP